MISESSSYQSFPRPLLIAVKRNARNYKQINDLCAEWPSWYSYSIAFRLHFQITRLPPLQSSHVSFFSSVFVFKGLVLGLWGDEGPKRNLHIGSRPRFNRGPCSAEKHHSHVSLQSNYMCCSHLCRHVAKQHKLIKGVLKISIANNYKFVYFSLSGLAKH